MEKKLKLQMIIKEHLYLMIKTNLFILMQVDYIMI